MTTDLARVPGRPAPFELTPEQQRAADEAVQSVVMHNDLMKLTPRQRVGHFLSRCFEHGLSPSDSPFDFLILDNKLVMYPNKGCAEQLRRKHQISIKIVGPRLDADLGMVVCVAEGRRANGQTDMASKYVPAVSTDRDGSRRPLSPQRLADAFHKAETGAKRRLTFSMVGLGGGAIVAGDDETVPSARRVWLDAEGNVVDHPTEQQRYLLEHPKEARIAGFRTIEDAGSADDAPLPSVDRTPTAAELAPPQRAAGPAPTFKATAEDVKRRLGAWFASVKGTSLDDDDDRHRFVRQFSGGRTESLREWFESATERQAADLLAHVRMLADEERAAIAAASGTDDDEPTAEERPF